MQKVRKFEILRTLRFFVQALHTMFLSRIGLYWVIALEQTVNTYDGFIIKNIWKTKEETLLTEIINKKISNLIKNDLSKESIL